MLVDKKKPLKLKLNPWADILKAVLAKKAKGQKAVLLNDDVCETAYCQAKKMFVRRGLPPKYLLVGKHGNTHFTGREAECMTLLLQGKTATDIATTLKLSLNEIYLYIRTMKAKVGCATNLELIDLVRGSGFTKNADNSLIVE